MQISKENKSMFETCSQAFFYHRSVTVLHHIVDSKINNKQTNIYKQASTKK